MIGRRLNSRYKLLNVVGDGGMAIVYRAEDLILDRIVAVKVLRAEFSSDEEFILRFRREAESATSLSHPNIVNIYDVGEEDHLYFIVMEYVEGKTLKEHIDEKAPLETEEALSIMKQIASAIRHAHENQIIHRDIKPHNILINELGEVKVTDFGIAIAMTSATITHTKSVIGSVHYFSPEQAKGSIANEQSDIYSLGIVLYEMLTGVRPFSGDSPITIALKHLQDDFTAPHELNPQIPEQVEHIICKAMEKDPLNRYHSVVDMQYDLADALDPTLVHPIREHSDIDDEETKILAPINQNDDAKSIQALDEQDEKPSSDKQKSRKKKPLWLKGLFALIIVGFLAFLFLPKLFYGKESTVPDVSDLPYAEAVELLEKNNLQYEREEEYNGDVEEEHVIRQNPRPDTIVKENSLVTVVVSLGKERTEIEDYKGKSKETVDRLLAEWDFKNVKWNEVESDEAGGTILSQQPEAGEKVVVEETELVLNYSSGVDTVLLENLTGKDKKAVEKYAKQNGLRIHYTEDYSDDIKKGRVISQQPNPYTEVRKGNEITVLLSKGKKERPPQGNEDKHKKQPITIDVSQPIEIEDGREFEVVIRVKDANIKNGVVIQETINQSKTYQFTLTVLPDDIASFQLYLNGEEVKTRTYSYEEAEKLG